MSLYHRGSQPGRNFAFNAALRHPEKIKALVAVEPSGTPNLASTDFSRIKGVPMLWVWGDYIGNYPFWTGIFNQQEKFRAKLVEAGGTGDHIVLPELQIHGNGHMLMMDRNSDQIAGLIDQWLARQKVKQ